jgi:UDP-glucose 4-epimerase
MKKEKGVFNVGTGIATSLNDLVLLLNKFLGKNIKPKYIEIPVKNYIDTQLADISKIKSMLGFVPKYTLEDGIKEMLAHS